MTEALLSGVSTGSTTEVRLRTRPAWPGVVAFALSLATVGALITAIVLATDDRFEYATYAAYGTAGISIVAVLFAVLALIVGRGRGWAVAAIVVAVAANPLVLTPALDAIGGLWA